MLLIKCNVRTYISSLITISLAKIKNGRPDFMTNDIFLCNPRARQFKRLNRTFNPCEPAMANRKGRKVNFVERKEEERMMLLFVDVGVCVSFYSTSFQCWFYYRWPHHDDDNSPSLWWSPWNKDDMEMTFTLYANARADFEAIRVLLALVTLRPSACLFRHVIILLQMKNVNARDTSKSVILFTLHRSSDSSSNNNSRASRIKRNVILGAHRSYLV